MTLEGEYYGSIPVGETTFNRRNPHDIGRRILRGFISRYFFNTLVAILMTLEGEYYKE